MQQTGEDLFGEVAAQGQTRCEDGRFGDTVQSQPEADN